MLVLIAAQSIDGFIARPDRPGTGFCSDADSRFLRNALQDFDSLIMGRKTYETLRNRILKSVTKRFLRKIVTRHPGTFSADARPGLVEFTDASPSSVLSELKTRGRKKTALLGGGEIYTHYLEEALVDELWITIEPLLFGGGTPLFTGASERSYELLESTKLGKDTVLLKYKPVRS
ncbi:dihydrofolate reductase family protein [Pelagicoccus sp. SDUM812002]|uniref:dihydrofolate reductase family protein n=1 Tax=Pelagicoccus sp. SDUM812002 TaxID=3041266 RepID=UPI00280C63D2|nr:dihydrofolate reductase family protein [Pelagicoccus sp. SDUM812002]MDQ8185991.1 dihydrofolate reductase family protein [Pelagicoccus sp. SDUM812002]